MNRFVKEYNVEVFVPVGDGKKIGHGQALFVVNVAVERQVQNILCRTSLYSLDPCDVFNQQWTPHLRTISQLGADESKVQSTSHGI